MNEESPAPQRRIVVLGVGNLLWADEGFGVRCVEALGEGFDVPPDVAVMDGGTLGLALVPELLDEYSAMVKRLAAAYYGRVTRYGTTGFLKSRL